jgi:hypothetical protein
VAVDLKCHDLFTRRSALLDARQLIILDHGLIGDRVRRVNFDRVDQVTLHKRLPIAPLTLLLLLVLVPGAILELIALGMRPGEEQWVVGGFGLALMCIAIGGIGWHAVCRQSCIAIQRGDQRYELRAVTTPARIRRFLNTLTHHIEHIQQRGETTTAGFDGGDATGPRVD